MSFTQPCGKCGAPLMQTDRFCRFCGDGRPQAPPPPEQDQIEALLHASRKIEAIKVYRERHKCGLGEAKDAVEEIEKRLGIVVR